MRLSSTQHTSYLHAYLFTDVLQYTRTYTLQDIDSGCMLGIWPDQHRVLIQSSDIVFLTVSTNVAGLVLQSTPSKPSVFSIAKRSFSLNS